MTRNLARRSRRKSPTRPAAPPAADAAGAGPPFDAGFFLEQLRGFLRDRCPPHDAGLPKVELHLVDGAVLDLCHVIGVSSAWAALAVNEPVGSSPHPRMRTELVPYASILRVTVHTQASEGAHIGFDARRAPLVLPAREAPLTPEGALRAAARGRDGTRPPRA